MVHWRMGWMRVDQTGMAAGMCQDAKSYNDLSPVHQTGWIRQGHTVKVMSMSRVGQLTSI